MHSRVVEQIVDLAVPLILETILEIIQLVPLERIKDHIVEHIGGVPVPQIKEDIVQNLVGEQIVDVPVPQIQDDGLQIVEECVQNRTPEQIEEQFVDSSVPQFMEERVQNRTPEQIMDFPVPQNMEVYAGIVRDTPLERVLHRTPEPVVDVPVPHIKEDGLLLVPQELVHNRAVYTGKVFTVKLCHHRGPDSALTSRGQLTGGSVPVPCCGA